MRDITVSLGCPCSANQVRHVYLQVKTVIRFVFVLFFFLIHSLCFLPPPPIQDRAGREVAGLPAFTEEVLPTETFAHDDTESVRTIQLGLVSVGHRERRLKDVLNLK